MIQDIYIDILFLINFSMDYLCLYICSKVLHRKIVLKRMLVASALGGLYSAVSLFFSLSPWLELLIDCVVCFVMCIIVYADKNRGAGSLFLSSFLFIGISMMTGGCMTAIFNLLNKPDLPLDSVEADSISTYLFAILAVISGIISLRSGELISRRASLKECRISVIFCGKNFDFLGFSDSGNLVREPISGKAVIFVERKIIEKQQSLSFLDDFLNGISYPDSPCKNLRIISLKSAVGTSIAVAALPEEIHAEIVNKKGKTVFVELDAMISPCDIGNNAHGYTAIVPSEIIKI